MLIVTLILALGSISALLVNISGLLQEPEIVSSAQEFEEQEPEEKFRGLTDAISRASTTNFTVSSTAIRLTASTTGGCAARVITVRNGNTVNITLSETNGDRPTATTGHMVSATNSPLVLTSQDVGCLAIYGIRSTGNDSALTITETQ